MLIRRRLTAVVAHFTPQQEKIDKVQKDRTDTSNMALIKQQGHHPIRNDGGGYLCSLCGQSWTPKTAATVIQAGQCPGDILWSTSDARCDRPIRVKEATGMIFRGVAIHPSHLLRWKRGVLYCARCGSYSARRVRGLRDVCIGKPTTSKRYGLRRILSGKTPAPGMKWPAHEHDKPPFHFLRREDGNRLTVVPPDPVYSAPICEELEITGEGSEEELDPHCTDSEGDQPDPDQPGEAQEPAQGQQGDVGTSSASSCGGESD